MNRKNIIVKNGRYSDFLICLQGTDLDKKIFDLLVKATQNTDLACTLLQQIIELTDKADKNENHDLEQQIKFLLEENLGNNLREADHDNRLSESHLAIVELMARSHVMRLARNH